ncbi:TRAP transporter small permease [Aestuariivirga sp.]|uniref:TRAP transporter small permease n=1 Tax=Aestuariivirga sp. TaxID=2650926 RepID=UPI00359349D5
MTQLFAGLRRMTDAAAAAMLAALFGVFLVQIAARYILNVPMGWTVEVCLTLWLWLVFWGGAFCLRPSDHVRFDVLYLSVKRPTQRVFGAVAAFVIIVAFAISFLPTLDYVSFYKIKRSGTLGIRMHYVFSIYLLFMLAIMARYGQLLFRFLAGRPDVEGKVTAYERHDEGSIT